MKAKDAELQNYKIKFEDKLANTESVLNKLKVEKKNLTEENDYLRNIIQDNEILELFDETSNRFTNDTLQCVMNLQNFNVSASNIGPVIENVCLLCKRKPNKVPSYTTVNRINDTRIAVATKQMKDICERKN